MIEGQSVLGLVAARGGSQTVPGKNLRSFGGKPLVTWAIGAALASKWIDRLILSSDDPKIISTAEAAGCEAPFRRPPELATDQAPSIDVAHHAISALAETYDLVALIQPTSPLVATLDIDGCIERCQSSGAPSCVSISKVDKNPAWMYQLSDDQELVPVVGEGSRAKRRQDLPPVYALNGAVFVARRAWLMENDDFIGSHTLGFEMPAERSVDIDTLLDFVIGEAMLGKKIDAEI
jgi:N-acylneuraminate cytidylyltransferase